MTGCRRLNPLDCIIHADDCRRIASISMVDAHRAMLNRMAETWDCMAIDIELRGMPAAAPGFK
jgi:hypothetical protein